MIKLTDAQQKHIESVEWLLDGPRASGRSTVILLAIIKHAAKNPGKRVFLFDHENHRRSTEHSLRQVPYLYEQIFSKEYRDFHDLSINFSDRSIVIRRVEQNGSHT